MRRRSVAGTAAMLTVAVSLSSVPARAAPGDACSAIPPAEATIDVETVDEEAADADSVEVAAG